MTHSGDIDALNVRLQEASQKVGALLKAQNNLQRELEVLSTEAEAKGFAQFATIFRAMAGQIGAPTNAHGKPEPTVPKRRGRPTKSAADGAAEAQ